MPIRSDLKKAYDEAVARAGRSAAVEAIEKVTGQWLLDSVPEDKIVALIAEWRTLPVASASAKGPRSSRRGGALQHIHSRLETMAASIFGPKGSHGGAR
jgi:hypothetical protein